MAGSGDYSRRQILGTGAGLAATVLAGPRVLRAADQTKDDVRCAMVGTGGRGTGVLKAIHKSPGIRVTALCDINRDHLNEAASVVEGDKPKLFEDYRKLVDHPEIDAVFIETPPHLHAEMVLAVLESGRHCYGEKPMAMNVPDLDAIVRAVKASKLVHQVGTQLRYASPWRLALDGIRDGLIGKPIQIHGRRLNAGDMPHGSLWYFKRELSGDVILEQAVHEFDLFNAAFGTIPERAAGFGGQAVLFEPKGRNIMDHFSVTLDYGPNKEAGYNHSWIAPKGASGWRFVVYGEKGSVELNNGRVFFRDSDRREQLEEESRADATQNAVDDFFRCIRESDKPAASTEAGRAAALVALMGRTAIYERRLVTLKEILAKA